jgi:hypothetical protein
LSFFDSPGRREAARNGGKADEADYFVCRCRRRNSDLVVEKREAQAQDLIGPEQQAAKLWYVAQFTFAHDALMWLVGAFHLAPPGMFRVREGVRNTV